MLLLQSSKKPTINVVVLAVIEIETSLRDTLLDIRLASDGGDAENFEAELLQELLNCIENKMRPFSKMELLGALLDPQMKNISKIKAEFPSGDAAKFLVDAIRDYVPEISDNADLVTGVEMPSEDKRSSLIAKYSSPGTPTENVENEVSRYLGLQVKFADIPGKGDSDYVSKWWRENATCFPSVSSLARIILAIPATSAEPERRFSSAGNALRERRCSMDPLTMTKTLFIHDNKSVLRLI